MIWMDRLDEFIYSNELITLYKVCDVDWCSVYHYTSPDGMLGILHPGGKAKLWFTRYDSLNDINERKEIVSFLDGCCSYQVKNQRRNALLKLTGGICLCQARTSG